MPEKVSAMKAIRAKCLDCAGSAHEVRLCQVCDCPLWQWRMNTRPTTLEKRRPELVDISAVRILAEKAYISEVTDGHPERFRESD